MSDPVNSPSHYVGKYPFEVKNAIRLIMNVYADELSPYECGCLYNELKYRLRAGFKNPDKIQEDIGKALYYNNERLNSEGKI
jgi:hypothetical protein